MPILLSPKNHFQTNPSTEKLSDRQEKDREENNSRTEAFEIKIFLSRVCVYLERVNMTSRKSPVGKSGELVAPRFEPVQSALVQQFRKETALEKQYKALMLASA